MSLKKRVVVLFSGEGTNLENLIQKLHGKERDGLYIQIVCAITNNPSAGGIKKAQGLGIPVIVIDHREFERREEFDERLAAAVAGCNPDLVILAGFMRILTPVFTQKVRAINLHPSLLPLFKGGNAIKESFNSPMLVGGVSVHWVSEELDSGKIIAQECFHKEPGETLESFTQKIHTLEYRLLPEVVVKILKEDKIP